ncbi:hypothetical protein RHGRI_021187 [Rhododendron griersonianum]|uniref:Uncharacterized protein n=1 Tax=Rhododendron griersonianum TaxID=479676 RepID=A0AAV6JMP0_9ERIC|nr:hypothetical protein RHGRI_021187 [Rhododendron griersonianum]
MNHICIYLLWLHVICLQELLVVLFLIIQISIDKLHFQLYVNPMLLSEEAYRYLQDRCGEIILILALYGVDILDPSTSK